MQEYSADNDIIVQEYSADNDNTHVQEYSADYDIIVQDYSVDNDIAHVQEYSAGWMSHILLRNVVATLLICGGWDWFLYFSPLAAKLHKYKINPVYPSMKQIRHDAGVTGRSHHINNHMQCSSCYSL